MKHVPKSNFALAPARPLRSGRRAKVSRIDLHPQRVVDVQHAAKRSFQHGLVVVGLGYETSLSAYRGPTGFRAAIDILQITPSAVQEITERYVTDGAELTHQFTLHTRNARLKVG